MSQHSEFRLVGNVSPMKLCDLCSTLNVDVLSRYGPQVFAKQSNEHQPNFTALETSASAGCEMCSMFMHAVIEVLCNHRDAKCSSVEALQVYRSAALGKASCLIETIWEGNEITGILYGAPDRFAERATPGYMGVDHMYAQFSLRNCKGVGDERIAQTELAQLPDWTITRQWIQECIKGHQKCLVRQTGNQENEVDAESSTMGLQLPTRLLYVGSTDDKDPHLVLGNKHTSDYVALSHCWGDKRPLTTTLLNFHQHLESIPMSTLPRTFQDAIIATRELGYQYLWIDSLCIIQDSTEDWELECAKMAHIYQNSRVTICGTTASDSSSGFLHPRTCPEPAPYLWEYTNTEEVEHKRATFSLDVDQERSSSRDYPSRRWLTRKESSSPLRLRGWILQEYLLSTRLLFFGLYRTYWQCSECVWFEDFQLPKDSSVKGLHCDISNSALSAFGIGNQSDLSEIWHSIVEEYRRRSLSKSSDALPALSGIADWILGGCGDDYAAGLLKHSLHIGLTWSIRKQEQIDGSGYWSSTRGLPKCRGPSWSWASTHHPISFVNLKTKWKTSSWSPHHEPVDEVRAMMSSMSQQNQMEVHDVSVTLHGSNPFGEVTSGTIKLRGRAKTGIIVATLENTTPAIVSNFAVQDPISKKRTGLFFPDDPRWDLPAKMGTGILKAEPPFDEGEEDSVALPRKVWPGEVKCVCIDYYFNKEATWAALAIEELPAEPEDPDEGHALETSAYKAYRRIGFVKGLHGVFSWFEDSALELIELF